MNLDYGIGDKVVHPTYGAGTVTAISEKRITGHSRRYYVIEPLVHDMQIMVSVKKATELGLRDVLQKSRVGHVLKILTACPDELCGDHKKRQERIEAGIKTADPFTMAEIVRDLSSFEKERGRLGSKDTKLLDRARGLLAAELALAEELDMEIAINKIDRALQSQVKLA